MAQNAAGEQISSGAVSDENDLIGISFQQAFIDPYCPRFWENGLGKLLGNCPYHSDDGSRMWQLGIPIHEGNRNPPADRNGERALAVPSPVEAHLKRDLITSCEVECHCLLKGIVDEKARLELRTERRKCTSR